MAGVREDAFPASSRQACGLVNGVSTEVSSTQFSDRILVTISQEGRLSQWVNSEANLSVASKALNSRQIQTPLMGPSPGMGDTALPGSARGLLPATHLTPKTLLGAGGDDRETFGQLYAAQIGSLLSLRDPEDKRTLVLGLGLAKHDTEREGFFDMIELAQKIL